MGIEIRTDFDTLEEALSWLTDNLKPAVEGLESEKVKLLAKRDELLTTNRKLKDKFSKFEQYADREDLDIDELLDIKEKFESGTSDVKDTYQRLYEKDRKKLEDRLKAIEDERKTEREQAEQQLKQAEAARIKSEAITELSKPQYGVRNPEQFYRLFFDGQVQRDDAGKLTIGDEYKTQSIGDRIKDLEGDEDNLHHFKASGVSGSGSSAGVGGAKAKTNPWKKETRNLTEQGRIIRENPELAKRLKSEAAK